MCGEQRPSRDMDGAGVIAVSFQGFASGRVPRASGVFEDESAAISEIDFRGF